MRPPLPPGPFLVVGLARSGVAAARLLAARGEEVVGVDAGEVTARAELEVAGVRVEAPSDGVARLGDAAVVVKSPGVPQEAPVIARARAGGRLVIGELELAWRLLAQDWIAVTGSNGKTTTVEWIGHAHRVAGVASVVAGNVGTPLTSLAGTLSPETVVIAEASSFQLEDTVEFAPDAGVLLNVSDDHLDRHGTVEAYTAAKLEIFARQRASQIAVMRTGFPGARGAARRVCFGAGGDADVADGALRWRGEELLPVADLGLRGAHNVENALAVAAVCLGRGLPAPAVTEALRSFRGVPHRLEEVARVDGVVYVNDSKATNVASAATGIASFPRGVHVILGGQGKGADFAPLAPVVAAHCSGAYLIGEDAPRIRAALRGSGVPLTDAGDLEAAVAAARAAAEPGDVVLLAPACASFDQFENFEARGDAFRALVTALR